MQITTSDAAWIALLPCALVVLLAIVALGEPLGGLLLSTPDVTFWSTTFPRVLPEPTEHARYLIAVTAPLLLAGATVALLRRPLQIPPTLTRGLVVTAQLAAGLFALVGLVAQRTLLYEPVYAEFVYAFRQPYFTPVTLVVSVAGAVGLAVAVRHRRMRDRLARWLRGGRGPAIAAWTVGVLAITVWLLHAFNTEGTIAFAHRGVSYHLQFTLDETYAVINGLTPLVDFTAQYGSLFPYGLAAAMGLLGTSIGVFTGLMCALTGLAMLAMLAVLRRVTRSPVAALLLFLPVLATSFFLLQGTLENRYTWANTFSGYPMRFALPWLVAWMTVRHLDGARPRRTWPLFLVAGLAAWNNTDHGIPAVIAVVAALLCTSGRPTRAQLRTLTLELVGGLLAATVLVAALVLVRTGSLPHLELLFRYARIYAGAGYGMLPMPTLGFHLVIYATFVGALGIATVRAIDEHPDRLLTGMLAWSGTFGLLAGSYFVGRSHPEVLVDSFGTWSFTVALLTVVVVRRLAAGAARWPSVPEGAVLVALLLCACSLAQTPAPWSQISRLRDTVEPVFRDPPGQPFVAGHVRPGEHVAILLPLGHRMAENLGVDNVSPYTNVLAMVTEEQLDDTVEALRDARGRKLFLIEADPVTGQSSAPEIPLALEREGYRLAAQQGPVTMWVDR